MFFNWKKGKPESKPNLAKPSIDLTAPTKIETATFALG